MHGIVEATPSAGTAAWANGRHRQSPDFVGFRRFPPDFVGFRRMSPDVAGCRQSPSTPTTLCSTRWPLVVVPLAAGAPRAAPTRGGEPTTDRDHYLHRFKSKNGVWAYCMNHCITANVIANRPHSAK